MATALAFEQSPRRTVTPEPNQQPRSAGVNLIRIVGEHGQMKLDDLDEEIMETERKLAELKHERDCVARLYEIASGFVPLAPPSTE